MRAKNYIIKVTEVLKNNNMHGYSDFFEDVKNVFSNLISKKNPVINLKSDINFGSYAVELDFEHSKLVFDLDRMDLQSSFVNPQDNEKYNILKIATILHPQTKFITKHKAIPETRLLILEYLKYTAEIVEKGLMNVVNGDFTWATAYLKNEKEGSKMIQDVLKLDTDDLISQKFWKGDETWKIDLKLRK